MVQILEKVKSFINSTRDVIYLREVDKILIIRPNKIQHLNNTAYEMLNSLYNLDESPENTIENLSKKYGINESDLYHDMTRLFESINAILNEEYSRADAIDVIDYDPTRIKYPVISEIALTYNCQNKCDFCYASSPYRGSFKKELSTSDFKIIINKIACEAHVPTISFTGGEPTLRKDLPELIAYANSLGMRTNLITNGIFCANAGFVNELKDAGLKSAQVSLESHDEKIHDDITGNPGSFLKTVQGIYNLKDASIHTHTNSTICQKNKDELKYLVKFIKEKFDFPYLSMNMIIKTGIARDNDNINLSYKNIGEILKPLINFCEVIGIKFVWYSPTPYCLFNPVDYNLGSKSCACVSGLLSVNPDGEVLPCSSFDRGIGNLLNNSFEYIWNSDQAYYWRDKRYVPPVCRQCKYEKLCNGACPLYWENAGSFYEIEEATGNRAKFKNLIWHIENMIRVKTKGVKGIK